MHLKRYGRVGGRASPKLRRVVRLAGSREACPGSATSTPPLSRVDRSAAAAVYFCVLEALPNVQKYAGAKSVAIQLGQQDGTLAFEVIDDGAGFDPGSTRRGAGLQNMEDRLDAL